MQQDEVGGRSKDKTSPEFRQKRREAQQKRRHSPGYIKSRYALAIKAALRKRDGDMCHYCGKPMRMENSPPGQREPDDLCTIEHVVPISQGGSREFSNLVLAHKKCNQLQGHRANHKCRPDHPHPCENCVPATNHCDENIVETSNTLSQSTTGAEDIPA